MSFPSSLPRLGKRAAQSSDPTKATIDWAVKRILLWTGAWFALTYVLAIVAKELSSLVPLGEETLADWTTRTGVVALYILMLILVSARVIGRAERAFTSARHRLCPDE